MPRLATPRWRRIPSPAGVIRSGDLGMPRDMVTKERQDELVDLERQGWDALCDGSGAEFYGRVMTPAGVMVMANGAVLDREAVVEALRQSPAWASYEIDDVRMVPVTDGAAALVYRGTGHRDGDGDSFVGLMTSTYVRDGDAWRLALYQQTPVADA